MNINEEEERKKIIEKIHAEQERKQIIEKIHAAQERKKNSKKIYVEAKRERKKFLDLNYDCFEKILNFTDVNATENLRLTCKKLQQDIDNFHGKPQIIDSIETYQNLKEEKKIDKIKRVNLSNNFIKDMKHFKIKETFPNIQSMKLSINQNSITQLISGKMNVLTHLNIVSPIKDNLFFLDLKKLKYLEKLASVKLSLVNEKTMNNLSFIITLQSLSATSYDFTILNSEPNPLSLKQHNKLSLKEFLIDNPGQNYPLPKIKELILRGNIDAFPISNLPNLTQIQLIPETENPEVIANLLKQVSCPEKLESLALPSTTSPSLKLSPFTNLKILRFSSEELAKKDPNSSIPIQHSLFEDKELSLPFVHHLSIHYNEHTQYQSQDFDRLSTVFPNLKSLQLTQKNLSTNTVNYEKLMAEELSTWMSKNSESDIQINLKGFNQKILKEKLDLTEAIIEEKDIDLIKKKNPKNKIRDDESTILQKSETGPSLSTGAIRKESSTLYPPKKMPKDCKIQSRSKLSPCVDDTTKSGNTSQKELKSRFSKLVFFGSNIEKNTEIKSNKMDKKKLKLPS